MEIEIEFRCLECDRSIIMSGDFDLEDILTCECGFSDEAWSFPHRIIKPFKTKLWTVGGHYTNDYPNDLGFLFYYYFFWDGKELVHGRQPNLWGETPEIIKEKIKKGQDEIVFPENPLLYIDFELV